MLKPLSIIDYHLVLQRFHYDRKFTIGKLYFLGAFFGYTLEPGYSDLTCAKPNGGAIPYGGYCTNLVYSNKFKRDLPEVIDVPGRTGIFFHSGNFPNDTDGCILLGDDYDLKGKLINSYMRFQYFISLYTLLIKDAGDVFLLIEK